MKRENLIWRKLKIHQCKNEGGPLLILICKYHLNKLSLSSNFQQVQLFIWKQSSRETSKIYLILMLISVNNKINEMPNENKLITLAHICKELHQYYRNACIQLQTEKP